MNKFYLKILLFSVCFLFCNTAFANLSIRPAVVNISAETNAVFKGKYYVTNPEDSAIVLTIGKEDWKNSSENSSDVTVDKWLKFEKNEYSIAPKETIEVPFEVITDKNMSGSISCKVVFITKGGMIQMQIKSPIYITIKGTENIDFEIEDDLRIVNNNYDGGKVFYMMNIKNNGNVHIRHSGVIEFYDKKKKNLLKKFDIEESFPTYSKESRLFSEYLFEKNEFSKGKYIAVFKIKAFDKEFEKEIKFAVSKTGEIKTEKSKK